jgi:hypothetical protein
MKGVRSGSCRSDGEALQDVHVQGKRDHNLSVGETQIDNL